MDIKQTTEKRRFLNSKLKKVTCFTLIFLVVFSLCGGVIGLFWAGGWAKDLTCSVVLEDSFIWDKMNCKTQEDTSSSIDQGENVIEMDIPEVIETTEELVTTIIESASPAVVTVTVDTLTFDYEKGFIDDSDGIGSGFVVDSDGLIITNQHVVSDENADYSIVLPNNDEAIPVEEVYRDNTNDIAILRVNKTGLSALKLGDSDSLKRGNLVVAIGNPFGDLEGTATVGYVTGLNRDVSAGSGFYGSVTHYEGVIQTDAAINPGNSGGPLLNSSGEVIGINFATTEGADNISFAIPINRVKSRLEIFEKEGRFPQPYIGITYTQRTVFFQKNVITGAIVYEVEKDGPADQAGVEKGDIILEIDGKSMEEYSLASIIQSSEVGSKLDLSIWREGEEISLKVTVGDMQD